MFKPSLDYKFIIYTKKLNVHFRCDAWLNRRCFFLNISAGNKSGVLKNVFFPKLFWV